MLAEISELRKIYDKYLDMGKMPLPRIIHVETRSKCNGICGFCPASIKTDKREDAFMPDKLIAKIIDELQGLDYHNRLSFYNNNEPFLDKRICDIIKLARGKLSKAYLELKSNGLVLTTEKVLEIFNCGLDMLYINDYSNNGQHHQKIKNIKDDLSQLRRFKGHFELGQYFSRVLISLGNIDDIKGSRAGDSPNKTYKGTILMEACFRPFEMVAINPKGEVSVCSEDFYHKINMGNLNNQSLLEIWTSPQWNNLRGKLIEGDRSCSLACSKCDYKGFNFEILMENNLYPAGKKTPLKKAASFLFNLAKK